MLFLINTAYDHKGDVASVTIGGMLFELTELEAPPIEFDEKLRHAVVDKVTVMGDDRLVCSLKDGTEITIALSENRKVPEWHRGRCYSGIFRCIHI